MQCFPLDNTLYDASAMGAWHGTRTRGVFSDDGHYNVTANGDMTITVHPGLGWIKTGEYSGSVAYEETPQVLTIDTADGVFPREDAVCIQLDKNMSICSLVIKRGGYTPQPPVPVAPVRNDNYEELYVATITVRAGSTSITQADINDQRLNEEYCGIMRDGVTGIPTQSLYDNWISWINNHKVDAQMAVEAWFGAFTADSRQRFEEWFAGAQNTLSEDAAGELYNLISQHKETAVASERGVHGLRYHGNNLEYLAGGEWNGMPLSMLDVDRLSVTDSLTIAGNEAWHEGNLIAERGTWTPVPRTIAGLPAISCTTSEGEYYRVGNMVWLSCVLVVNQVLNAGNMFVDSIPFAPSNSYGVFPWYVTTSTNMHSAQRFIGQGLSTKGWSNITFSRGADGFLSSGSLVSGNMIVCAGTYTIN